MSDASRNGPQQDPQKDTVVSAGNADATAKPIAATDVTAATDAAAPANKLTPEEQMALFEKELKENDWGHQPC